jgi:hypothetical protein
MVPTPERITILEMIEEGIISPDEGLRLLRAIEGDSAEAQNEAIQKVDIAHEGLEDKTPPRIEPEEIEKWRRWWMIPLWVGVGITTLGGILMYWAWAANGFGFWFACAWFPFLLGVGAMAVAWGSRKARWLHLRVQQKPGQRPERIAISFPIPLGLTAWFLRNFGGLIPNLDATGIDELVLALRDSATTEEPLYIEVDEEDSGERVQIFIG